MVMNNSKRNFSLGVLILAGILGTPLAAHAVNAGKLKWTLRVEPGVAFPLGAPQSDRFTPGGGATIKGGITPLTLLDIHLTANLFGFAGKDSYAGGGNFAFGGGARFIWRSDRIFAPWVDGDLLYVRTGSLNRFGFDVGIGMAFALTPARMFWLGPYLRYEQIVSTDQPNFDTTDAKILIFGVALEIRTPRAVPSQVTSFANDSDGDGIPDKEDKCPTVAGKASAEGCPDSDGDGIADSEDKCPTVAGKASAHGCPDSDGDGIADSEDKCPTLFGKESAQGCPDSDDDGVADSEDKCPLIPGEADNQGCPRYREIVVKKNRIDLKQKIHFDFDKAIILAKSYAVLNEVVQALNDYPTIKLRIDGHTDAIGTEDYNLNLSVERAEAVRVYLITHGIVPHRLTTKGYGATVPLDNNNSDEGREHNRRVEFMIIYR